MKLNESLAVTKSTESVRKHANYMAAIEAAKKTNQIKRSLAKRAMRNHLDEVKQDFKAGTNLSNELHEEALQIIEAREERTMFIGTMLRAMDMPGVEKRSKTYLSEYPGSGAERRRYGPIEVTSVHYELPPTSLEAIEISGIFSGDSLRREDLNSAKLKVKTGSSEFTVSYVPKSSETESGVALYQRKSTEGYELPVDEIRVSDLLDLVNSQLDQYQVKV